MPHTISYTEALREQTHRALDIPSDAPDDLKTWGVYVLAGGGNMNLPADMMENPSATLPKLQEVYRTNSIKPMLTDDFAETEELWNKANAGGEDAQGAWDELAKRSGESDSVWTRLDAAGALTGAELQDVSWLMQEFPDFMERGQAVEQALQDIRRNPGERGVNIPTYDLEGKREAFEPYRQEARKRLAARRHVERVRQKNAFAMMASILPDLTDEAKAVIDRAAANGYKLADGDEGAFLNGSPTALPEDQQELVASYLQYVKPTDGSGAWGQFGKRMGDQAWSVTKNTGSEFADLFTGRMFRGEEYNNLVRQRAVMERINARNFKELGWLGRSVAEVGGVIGYWSPMLAELALSGAGGAVAKAGWMAKLARAGGAASKAGRALAWTGRVAPKFIGHAMFTADFMEQYKQRVVLDGGDVSDPKVQLVMFGAGLAANAVEHISWETFTGKVLRTEVQSQAYAKLFGNFLKRFGVKIGTGWENMTVGKALLHWGGHVAASTASEMLEEGFQQAIEETVVDIGDGRSVRLGNLMEQGAEAFTNTFGPMVWLSVLGSPFRAKNMATAHNLDQGAIKRLMSASERLKSLAAQGKLTDGREDVAALNQLMFAVTRAPNAREAVNEMLRRGFSWNQANGIVENFQAIQREAIERGQLGELGENVLPTQEELERTGWQVTPNDDGTLTATRDIETEDGKRRRQTLNVRRVASQAVDVQQDAQAASTLNYMREQGEASRATYAALGIDLNLANEEILADPNARNALALVAARENLRTAGDTRQMETRQAQDAQGNTIEEDVFDVTLAEQATRQTIFHEVAHAVAKTLRNMGLSEKEVEAIQNWRSGRDGRAAAVADLALPELYSELWNEERVGDEMGDILAGADEASKGRVAKAMNLVGDLVKRVLHIQKRQAAFRDAVAVYEEVIRSGKWGNIDELTDAQKRLLAEARQKRAEARERTEQQARPAAGATDSTTPNGEQEGQEGPSSGEEGTKPDTGKSRLERVVEAFCFNKPILRDDMEELAASGELTEDDIYETGYRWSPLLRCWTVRPECRNQPFTPNGPYMGLDGPWRGEAARNAVTGRLVPGADLSDAETARELVNYFKTYEGEEPPKRLLDASPAATYAWFKENLVGKTFLIADRTFTVKEGHYFRFVCETPEGDRVRKGWIGRADSPEEARRLVESGAAEATEIAGYVPARAASLPFATAIFTKPDAILTKGHKEYLLKKFKTGNANTDVAVFLLNRDGETLGLSSIHMREIGVGFLNGCTLAAFANEGASSPPGSLARDVLSPTDDARDTSAGTPRSQPQNAPNVNPENQARASVAPRLPSPEFAMDGTIADALPAHLREDARAIIAERANTPAWMVEPDGTPTDLNERDWLRREAERRHNLPRFAISGLYTGSAADYAQRDEDGNIVNGPSLQYVGRGAGSSYYGWGLYATSDKNGANTYANKVSGQTEEGRPYRFRNKKNGWTSTLTRMQQLGLADSDGSLTKKAIREGWIPIAPIGPHVIYEQTFFTNRTTPEETERHLLDWDTEVPSEQLKWVKNAIEEVSDDKIEEFLDKIALVESDDGIITGEALYQALSETLGSPQGASELLVKADIDGIKFNDNSADYVSFRDDNIRVDHKWVGGGQRYSLASTLATGRDSTASYTDSQGVKRTLVVERGTRKHGMLKVAYKHCVDYGTAWTGGFTLDELGRYERKILDEGERTFNKATGDLTFKWKSPEGVTFTVGAYTRGKGKNAREVVNTVYTDRDQSQTKMLGTHFTGQAPIGQPSGGNLPRGQTKGKFKKRYQIAGRAGAERLGIRGLGDAEAMERSGATREEIWRETGWWRGADGKWRVEIGDIRLADDWKEKVKAGCQLRDIVSGPPLEAYDNAIGGVWVSVDQSLKGSSTVGVFNIRLGTIRINPNGTRSKSGFLTTLAHEIQHTIQLEEGLERGTSLSYQMDVRERQVDMTAFPKAWWEYERRNKEFIPALSRFVESIAEPWLRYIHDASIDEKGRVKFPYETKDEFPRINGRMIRSLSDIAKGVEKKLNRWKFYDIGGLARNGDLADVLRRVGADELGWFLADAMKESYGEENTKWATYAQEAYAKMAAEAAAGIEEADAVVKEISRPLDEAFADARNAYNNAGGEVEARMVEARLGLTEEQRKEIPPWVTEAVVRQDTFTKQADYSYAAQRAMMERMGGGIEAEERELTGKRFSIQAFADGTRFVHVDTDQALFDNAKEKDYPKIARRIILNRFRGKVVGGEKPQNAYVKTETAGEFAYPAKPLPREENSAKMRSAGELGNLLAVGEFSGHKPDDGTHPEAIGGWDYYNTIFEVGGKFFAGKVNILINKRGRVFHDVTGVKENSQGLKGQHGEPRALFPASDTQGNIAQHGEPRVESLGANASQASPGAEVKSENGEKKRSAVQGRVRAFDDVPRYSPRGTMAALATLSYIAGEEPNAEYLDEVGRRLGGEGVEAREVMAEAKAIHDATLGRLSRKQDKIILQVAQEVAKDADMTPGEVAELVAGAIQALHPEDLVREAYMRGAGAQDWAQGTRGAALNTLVKQARGDNYADTVAETGLDATGVLHRMLLEKPPQPKAEGVGSSAGDGDAQRVPGSDVGPQTQEVYEAADALSAQQEANLERALAEANEEMERRRAELGEREAQRAAEDQPDDDGDDDDDGGDVDENDHGGEADSIQIPVEMMEKHLVNVRDPATFSCLLRKITRNRILKANGMETDFDDLDEAHRVERELWSNPTNVAMFAKSMGAILRDMANRMLDHGSGAYTALIRKAALLPHYDSVDVIELEMQWAVRTLAGASIRQTTAGIVNHTRAVLKRHIGPTAKNEHPELEEDLTRRITGRVREMAKWYRRVLSMSEGQVERVRDGWNDKDGKHHDGLRDILDQRGRALDEAGITGEANRENDAVFSKAAWRLAVLNQYGGTRYLLPAEARERCTEIETWMAKEALAWAQKIEAIEAKYEADRKTILEGCAVVDPKTGEKRIHEEETKGERLWRFTVNTINQRLRFLFARATGDSRKAADELIRRYSIELTRGTTRYIREKQNMRRDLVLAVRSVVGPRGVRKWLARMMEKIPEEQAVAISRQGNRHLTYGQVMHVYGYLRQTATYGDNIAKHGRDGQRDYIEKNILSPEDVKILNLMMKIYGDRRQALDEASRELTGFPMKNPDPFYLPVKIKTPTQSGLETVVSTVQAMPDVFSERRRHGLDVDEKADIMVIFHDRMEKTARVLGFGRTGLDIIHTFGNGKVKEAITEARGAKFTKALIAHFTDWMNGGRPRLLTAGGDDAKLLNGLRTAFVYQALWGNMLSAFKQTLSSPVFTLAREVGERGIFQDMAGMFSDGWKQAKAELTTSEPYKARYGDVGIMQETQEAVIGAGEGTLWQAILRAGMTPLQWGDQTPGILCQVTEYMVERDRLIEQGVDPEEAKRRAADKAMQDVEWTQQSSRTENLPEYSRRGDAGTRMLMMFASSPMLQAGWQVQRYIEWKEKKEAFGENSKEAKDAKRAMWNAVIVNHVVMPILFQVATAVFNLALGKEPPDEDDLLELVFAMLAGPFARLVFFGGMAKAVWNAWWSKGIYGRHDVIPSMLTNAEQNAVDIFANVPGDILTGDIDEALEDLDRFLKRNVAPYRHVRQAVENYAQ